MTQQPIDILEIPPVVTGLLSGPLYSSIVPGSLTFLQPGRPPRSVMHICKERSRISDVLRHSLMMTKDKMEVTEKILNLTLEIIFLLTGEDFVLSKKQNDQSSDDCQACLSEGPTKVKSPSKESICQTSAPEETTEEETPKPTKTTNSNTQEFPVRCEDVAVFFSMEEWEYLEGHKERYKNLVSEKHQLPISASCEGVTAVDEDEELQNIPVDPSSTIADASITAGRVPTNPPESCMSPLVSDQEEESRSVSQESQAHPEEGTSSPQCKEEDVPVEIGSGDQRSVNRPKIRGSPARTQDHVEKDNGTSPQEYQDVDGDNMLLSWCKKDPEPSKITTGLPTSWKVQPNSPHLLIPVHKKGVNPNNPEGSIPSDSPPMVVMVKPKTVPNDVPALKCRTDQPHLYWQKPRKDGSSSSLMKYTSGASNVQPVLESPIVHKCLQCGRGFRNEIDLFCHQRTHKKMYHCALCQQSFMDKAALVVHEWTFHIHEPKVGEPQPKHVAKEERPFSCLECGKSFMKKSSLVKHQRIHTGAFACPDCGKCLSDKTGLIIHRRTHTGEKPYACSECGRRFTQRCHLITHQSVHTGKESFACADCGKCFPVRSVLEAHQAFHNRHKAFPCSDCGKSFLQRSALMAHSKVHARGTEPRS